MAPSPPSTPTPPEPPAPHPPTSASHSPASQNSPASVAPEAFQRAVQCLRSLQQDIAIFRDPQVRDYLNTMPSPLPSSDAAPPRTPAQLNATVISLRTALSSAEDALKAAEDAELRLRKRAARAEAQVAELQSQAESRDNAHQAAVDAAADSLRSLHAQSDAAHTHNANKIASLSHKLDSLRAELQRVSAEKDTTVADARQNAARAAALEGQLHAQRQVRSVEQRAAETALAERDATIAQLRSSVTALTATSGEAARAEACQLHDARGMIAKQQKDALAHKNEIKWQSAKIARLERELSARDLDAARRRDADADNVRREARVAELEARLAVLSVEARDARETRANVEALAHEKDEVCALVAALSPERDVQKGLEVLRRFASRGTAVLNEHVMGADDAASGVKFCAGDEQDVDSIKGRVAQLDARVQRVELEKAQAMSERDEHKRACRALMKQFAPLVDESSPRLRAEFLASLQTGSVSGTAQFRMVDGDDKHRQVQELKGLCQDKDKVIADLREEVKRSDKQLEDVRKAEKLLVTQLEEKEKLARSISPRAGAEQASLVNRVADGNLDYDPKLMKVYHFINNPLQAALREEAENRAKVRGKKRSRVEDSPMRDGADRESAVVVELNGQIAEMEQTMKDHEQKAKLGMRMRQIALKRIEEVRRAVYNLFGWSMKVNGANYTLASIYAESPLENLIFCVNETGAMSLVESQYANDLENELEQYVGRMNSFPALLAHITMTNFEKTTVFTSGAS